MHLQNFITQGRIQAELPEAHNSVKNPTIAFFKIRE